MKAVVLAAGKGERLWPLTENRPKPMIPVANRPILDHLLDALEGAGINEVVLVVGSNRERVQDYVGDGHNRALDITYSFRNSSSGPVTPCSRPSHGSASRFSRSTAIESSVGTPSKPSGSATSKPTIR